MDLVSLSALSFRSLFRQLIDSRDEDEPIFHGIIGNDQE